MGDKSWLRNDKAIIIISLGKFFTSLLDLHEHLLKEQIRNIKLQDHVFELNTINERHQIDV